MGGVAKHRGIRKQDVQKASRDPFFLKVFFASVWGLIRHPVTWGGTHSVSTLTQCRVY